MPARPSGVTYTVTDVGDQNQVPVSERDSVALRYIIRTAAGDEITSSYERAIRCVRWSAT